MTYSINSNLTALPNHVDKIKLLRWLAFKGGANLQVLVPSIIEIGKDLGVNPIYILAHAVHESAFGQSNIAKKKNNLFGYGAVDATPFESAWTFPNRENCILYVMWKVKRHYLTPEGRFWGGEPSLAGMNKLYASDKLWAEKICRLMNEIEDFA